MLSSAVFLLKQLVLGYRKISKIYIGYIAKISYIHYIVLVVYLQNVVCYIGREQRLRKIS